MQVVTRYMADDGSEWCLRESALIRDSLVAETKKLMSLLGERPVKTGTHKQQNADDIAHIKAGLFAVANTDGVLRWWIDSIRHRFSSEADMIRNIHPSVFVRVLECSHAPLLNAYARLNCIDKHGREWDQPYYANKADQE